MANAAGNGYPVPGASATAPVATGGYESASMAIPKRLGEQSTLTATVTALHRITPTYGIGSRGEEVICVDSKSEFDAGSEPMDLESEFEFESDLAPSAFGRSITEESSQATSISSEQTATTVVNTPRPTLWDLATEAELMRDPSGTAHNSPRIVHPDTSPGPEWELLQSGYQRHGAAEIPSIPTVEPDNSQVENTEARIKKRPQSCISDWEMTIPVPMGLQALPQADIISLRDLVSHDRDGDATHTTLGNGDNENCNSNRGINDDDTSVTSVNNKNHKAGGNGSHDDKAAKENSREDDGDDDGEDDGDDNGEDDGDDDDENDNGNNDSDYIDDSSEDGGEEAEHLSFAGRRNGGKKRRHSPPDKPDRSLPAHDNLKQPLKRRRGDHSTTSTIPRRRAHSEPCLPRIPSPCSLRTPSKSFYNEQSISNVVLKTVCIEGRWSYTLTLEGLNEVPGPPQVQLPPAEDSCSPQTQSPGKARSRSRRKFSEEEDNLIIELRDSRNLSWKKVSEEFNETLKQRWQAFEPRSQASLQVHYSTTLKDRIEEEMSPNPTA